jgi:hypothetical protein
MDDAEGVGLGQGHARLTDVGRGFVLGQRAVFLHEHAEISAFAVLHHDERGALGGAAHVEHAGHVFTRQARGRLRFAPKSPHEMAFVAQRWQQKLDRQRLPRRLVSREHHRAHAALPEEPLRPVFSGHQRARRDREGRQIGHAQGKNIRDGRLPRDRPR